jgi:hypothetical protein
MSTSIEVNMEEWNMIPTEKYIELLSSSSEHAKLGAIRALKERMKDEPAKTIRALVSAENVKMNLKCRIIGEFLSENQGLMRNPQIRRLIQPISRTMVFRCYAGEELREDRYGFYSPQKRRAAAAAAAAASVDDNCASASAVSVSDNNNVATSDNNNTATTWVAGVVPSATSNVAAAASSATPDSHDEYGSLPVFEDDCADSVSHADTASASVTYTHDYGPLPDFDSDDFDDGPGYRSC